MHYSLASHSFSAQLITQWQINACPVHHSNYPSLSFFGVFTRNVTKLHIFHLFLAFYARPCKVEHMIRHTMV